MNIIKKGRGGVDWVGFPPLGGFFFDVALLQDYYLN
jgi:hypothetical protein